jgi:aryl carrier-like protein
MPDYPVDTAQDAGTQLSTAGGGYRQPSAGSATAAELGSMWVATVGSPPSSAEANFFIEGGNSLRAMRLMAQVRRRWGTALKLRELFDYPTIASLSARIDEVTTARQSEMEVASNGR